MVRLFIFTAFLIFINYNALAAAGYKLSWAPPAQINPTRVSISHAEDAGVIDVIRLNAKGETLSHKQFPLTKKITIEFRDDEDGIIELPKDRILALSGLGVNGGRNIRLIGGSLMGIAPADKSLRAVLRFAGQAGSVFLEGLVIDAREQYGLDGILVGSVRHKPGVVADIYIQNCLIRNVSSTREGLHADGFQFYGSTGKTRMDRVSIRSQYQGLFLDPQADIGAIDLRHVDMDYTYPATGKGYIFFLRHEANTRHRPDVMLSDVYAGTRTNKLPWQEYSIYPPASRSVGNVTRHGRAVFPAFPEVEGAVIQGAPPEGDYVTDRSAGLDYRSPGYQP